MSSFSSLTALRHQLKMKLIIKAILTACFLSNAMCTDGVLEEAGSDCEFNKHDRFKQSKTKNSNQKI